MILEWSSFPRAVMHTGRPKFVRFGKNPEKLEKNRVSFRGRLVFRDFVRPKTREIPKNTHAIQAITGFSLTQMTHNYLEILW